MSDDPNDLDGWKAYMPFRLVADMTAPYPPTMLRASDIRWAVRSDVEQDIYDVFEMPYLYDDPNVIDIVAVRSEIVRPESLALPSLLLGPGEEE